MSRDGGAVHTESGLRCAVCGAEPTRTDVQSARLSVRRCRACGHSVAIHVPLERVVNGDYHRQYDQSGFLEALARTRRRQGRRIASLVKQHLPGATSIADFGSGRGWFLESARDAGFPRLAGLDTSPLAVGLLRERGFEGVLLDESTDLTALAERLSFSPEVLVALDVIEHFPPTGVKPLLQALVEALRPRLLIIKVPSNGGLLYRSARVLAGVGMLGPLEQLYQVGTEPPHFNYFSRRSLGLLVAQCGLDTLDVQADRDFESEDFSARVGALRRFGRLGRPIGTLASSVADALGLQDSLILVARAQ